MRYKVNLVHFVDADNPDAAIAAARDGREPVIGEAIPWGSSASLEPAHPGPAAPESGDPRDVAAGIRTELENGETT